MRRRNAAMMFSTIACACGLGRRREVLRDVELADRVAQRRRSSRRPRASSGRAASSCPKAPCRRSANALLGERLRQERRGAVDRVEGQVVLPHGERLLAASAAMPVVAVGCQTISIGCAERPAAAKYAFQSRPGALRSRIRPAARVVRLQHVHRVGAAAVDAGDLPLEVVDPAAALGLARRTSPASLRSAAMWALYFACEFDGLRRPCRGSCRGPACPARPAAGSATCLSGSGEVRRDPEPERTARCGSSVLLSASTSARSPAPRTRASERLRP